MGKNKKLIILAVLLVVVIFVWVRAFVFPPGKKGNRTAGGIADSSSANKISEKQARQTYLAYCNN